MSFRVVDLSLAFDSRTVLRGVNAHFPAGSFTVVLGPNGVGKTTLLRAMIGARPAESGVVELAGRPMDTMSLSERASRLAYVPQRSAVEFAFTVSEVVALGRYSQRAATDDAVARALRAVGLEEMGARAFFELSVGQQQRATLARALAQLDLPGGDPRGKVLLADEPVASLDPAHALATLSLLRTLANNGLCVIAVVHDLSLALRHADRALVLSNEGAAEALAPIREIIDRKVLDRVYGVRLEPPGPDDLVLVPRQNSLAPDPKA